MTYREIVTEIERLPQAEQRTLLEWLSQRIQPRPRRAKDEIPPATLVRARNIARNAGLHYVYTGNVHNAEGDTTFCPACQQPLIERDWYEIRHSRLAAGGHCPACGAAVAGRFDAKGGNFGRHRIPVTIHRP